MKASKGLKRGTRRLFKAELRDKFKPESYIQEFKPGDKVIIKISPSSRRSAIHHRFNGKMGIVKGKRGDAFVLETFLGGKKKEIHATPEHLKKAKE